MLGIDHRGLLDIKGAGDATALNLSLHNGARYPLARLALYAALAGLARAGRGERAARRARRGERRPAAREPAVGAGA